MHVQRASTELGRFFFQPLDLHLQSADLLEQLFLVVLFDALLATPILEQVRGASKSRCFQVEICVACTPN